MAVPKTTNWVQGLEFVPCDKMASLHGEVVRCFIFGEDAKISLAQTVLG